MKGITFECPCCHKTLAVDADLQGQSANCVDCRSLMVVPVPDL